MAKKGSLLNEIGNIVNESNKDINVFDINFEILSSLNKKIMNLKDKRNGSYDLHYMNEIVIIVFFALLSNCDEWTQIYMFSVQHETWLKSFLKLPYGLPSISTIKKIMSMVEPRDLETIYVEFMILSWSFSLINLHLKVYMV